MRGADLDARGALHVASISELAVVVAAMLAELGVGDAVDQVVAAGAPTRTVKGAERVLAFRVANLWHCAHIGHAVIVLTGVSSAVLALPCAGGTESWFGALGLLAVVVLAVCEEFAPRGGQDLIVAKSPTTAICNPFS